MLGGVEAPNKPAIKAINTLIPASSLVDIARYNQTNGKAAYCTDKGRKQTGKGKYLGNCMRRRPGTFKNTYFTAAFQAKHKDGVGHIEYPYKGDKGHNYKQNNPCNLQIRHKIPVDTAPVIYLPVFPVCIPQFNACSGTSVSIVFVFSAYKDSAVFLSGRMAHPVADDTNVHVLSRSW